MSRHWRSPIEGRLPEALAATLKHVDAWPRDAMVLAMPLGAFGLYAFSGMADHDQARQDLCERVAHHYGEDWWFSDAVGLGHDRERQCRRAAAPSPSAALRSARENAHAAHAVLHAMFEDGSIDEADRLVDELDPPYGRDGILHGHIRWHQALGALEHGDAAKALTIYTDVLDARTSRRRRHSMSSPTAASLLWRLVGLWSCRAEGALGRGRHGCAKTVSEIEHSLCRCRMALFAAATQNREALTARMAVIEQRLADGKLPAGPWYRRSAAP